MLLSAHLCDALALENLAAAPHMHLCRGTRQPAGRPCALNEHLRRMRRRKRLEDMQAVRASSQRSGQKLIMYVCMCMCMCVHCTLRSRVHAVSGARCCGHGRAGKSSVLRLLGGLWPLPNGRMALPASDTAAGPGRQACPPPPPPLPPPLLPHVSFCAFALTPYPSTSRNFCPCTSSQAALHLSVNRFRLKSQVLLDRRAPKQQRRARRRPP